MASPFSRMPEYYNNFDFTGRGMYGFSNVPFPFTLPHQCCGCYGSASEWFEAYHRQSDNPVTPTYLVTIRLPVCIKCKVDEMMVKPEI